MYKGLGPVESNQKMINLIRELFLSPLPAFDLQGTPRTLSATLLAMVALFGVCDINTGYNV